MSKVEVNTIDTVDNTALTIKQNDTTAITVDTSQNVGIGTTSPSRQFQVSATDAQISALSSTSSGSSAVHFGDSDDDNVGQVNYQHSDDSMRFIANATERMRIANNGKVSVGDTIPYSGGSVNGVQLHSGPPVACSRDSTAGRTQVQFDNPNGTVGSIQTSGSSTSYNTSSDYRLKENVIDLADATTRVKQLQPKRFNFIADADTTVDGFLAHEVSSVVPEAITGTHNEVDDDGNPVYQGIDQSKLVPLLTASLQEALTEIDNLKARIEALENA